MLGGCSGQLTPEQIFHVAVSAGFPPETAIKMVAIALKESSGCPGAQNFRQPGTNGPNDPGEESYGLWQINVGPRGNHTLPARMGLSSKSQLFDPLVNAKAAYLLWNGSDRNLDIAWYIDRDTANRDREKFLSFLPVAQQAAQNVLGDGFHLPDENPIQLSGLLIAGLAGVLLLDLLRGDAN